MTVAPAHSRRRFLRLSAAIAGCTLLPGVGAAGTGATPAPVVWHGIALGAAASLTLYHPDRSLAKAAIAAARAEIERLESIFSLYRKDSAIMRLNRDGRLDDPPPALLRLLGQAKSIARLTDGAFDPTVQPLWRLYAAHFAGPTPDPSGPNPAALEAALSLVDHESLVVKSKELRFETPGMAITLNGIAQGYITDRVAELLRRRGLSQVLVDLGEQRALGRHPSGRAWRAGIQDPAEPSRLAREMMLEDAALATSAGAGTRFEPSGRHHHLFDPRSGLSSRLHASVSVLAPTANLADGLSTACSNLDEPAIAALCRRLPAIKVVTIDGRGASKRFGLG